LFVLLPAYEAWGLVWAENHSETDHQYYAKMTH